MKASYFPGCTLRTKAKELDVWARKCAEFLGITLEEPADWQCCGGVFSTATDEVASKLAAVRALRAARDAGQPLVTVCSACHNVIKQTNHAMRTDAEFAARVNNYMAEEVSYRGETEVLHYLELLRDKVGFDELAKKVVKPLTAARSPRTMAACSCVRPRPCRWMIRKIRRFWKISSAHWVQPRRIMRRATNAAVDICRWKTNRQPPNRAAVFWKAHLQTVRNRW